MNKPLKILACATLALIAFDAGILAEKYRSGGTVSVKYIEAKPIQCERMQQEILCKTATGPNTANQCSITRGSKTPTAAAVNNTMAGRNNSLKETTMIKTCSSCKRRLLTSEFNKDLSKHDGLRSQCKSCTKKTGVACYEKNKSRIIRHKIDYHRGRGFTKKFRTRVRTENRQLISARMGIIWKCEICGFDKYPEALDFHHVNADEKKYNVGVLMGQRNEKDLLEEISKCELLCANCHRHLHFNTDDNDNSLPASNVYKTLDLLWSAESGRGREMSGDGGQAKGHFQQHRNNWAEGCSLLGVHWAYPEDTNNLAKSAAIVAANWARYAPKALTAGEIEMLIRIHRFPSNPMRVDNDIYVKRTLGIKQ